MTAATVLHPPAANPRVGVVSVGYQGRTIDTFGATLSAMGVTTLVDVRLTPISRRAGFSKTKLAAAMASFDIAYRHMPALGNLKDNRAPFGSPDTVHIGRERFRSRLQDDAGRAALADLTELTRTELAAILCFEKDHEQCHRQVIISALVAGSNPDVFRL